MAVGASFSQSIGMGVGTTIAVVCHEIPHELGNYAVLIKCGFTHWQALVFNLISASTCTIGFFIGVSIAADPEVSRWIFAITAGMFLYISLVDLVTLFAYVLLINIKFSFLINTTIKISNLVSVYIVGWKVELDEVCGVQCGPMGRFYYHVLASGFRRSH